jgi:hypothetical protein
MPCCTLVREEKTEVCSGQKSDPETREAEFPQVTMYVICQKPYPGMCHAPDWCEKHGVCAQGA